MATKTTTVKKEAPIVDLKQKARDLEVKVTLQSLTKSLQEVLDDIKELEELFESEMEEKPGILNRIKMRVHKMTAEEE